MIAEHLFCEIQHFAGMTGKIAAMRVLERIRRKQNEKTKHTDFIV